MKKLLFGLTAIFFAFSAYADNVDNVLLGADKSGDACQQIGNTTICWKNQGGSAGASDSCDNKNEKDPCTSNGATEARCQYNGGSTLRCTAKKCKQNYFLWVTSKRSKNVQSYEDYQSQGVCIHKSWCDKWCATCPDCTECKLHTFTWHGLDATDEICFQQKAQPTDNETQVDNKPDDKKPEDKKPDNKKPDEPKPDDKKPDDKKPGKQKIDNTKPNDKATVWCTTTGCYESSVFERLNPILDEHFSTEKLSVWKDENGNFNTARLASDSIAGVVLGTVGGIVTSKIIKKNQIKNGFDDLKCTINGQDVATYGDEFRVGIN